MFYAGFCPYGIRTSFKSWQVLGFKTKKDRDSFVDKKYRSDLLDQQYVAIDYVTVSEILGKQTKNLKYFVDHDKTVHRVYYNSNIGVIL